MEKLIPLMPLVGAYLLDLWLADPERWSHPIRWFGKAISIGEKALNRGSFKMIKGMILTLSYVIIVFVSFYNLDKWLWNHSLIGWGIFNLIFIFWGIANQSLIDASREVFLKLEEGLEAARKQLSYIVGRDTQNLNEQQVMTATLETMSENLSDGVIAPLFYYGLLGLPGIMTYKLINTFDSMIGYKNQRYALFGFFAAKLDDIVNYIPARLTVLLLMLSSFNFNSILYAARYGHRHKSPNAGYPEAATAGILKCRFGGPNYYNGKLVNKPYIGDQEKTLKPKDFERVARLNHTATFICILIIILVKIWQQKL